MDSLGFFVTRIGRLFPNLIEGFVGISMHIPLFVNPDFATRGSVKLSVVWPVLFAMNWTRHICTKCVKVEPSWTEIFLFIENVMQFGRAGDVTGSATFLKDR